MAFNRLRPRVHNLWKTRSAGGRKALLRLLLLLLIPLLPTACRTPAEYRKEADERAIGIILEKQRQALNRDDAFTIERPGDILRRRLLIDQKLPYAGHASLGADKLPAIEQWPEEGYPQTTSGPGRVDDYRAGEPVQLSLLQALQIGARNNFEYQTNKENIFKAALDLDLEQNDFRSIFKGAMEGRLSADLTGSETKAGNENSADLKMDRQFQSGARFTTSLAVDLVKLLTQSRSSSLGITGDATMTIPLLRGSGRHIVTEPLTQAERNVIYTFWEFEKFRQELAVDICKAYLEVLKRQNEIDNSAENYRNLIGSTRRTHRLADAGRATEVELNQSLQNELRARNRWISAREVHRAKMDSLKRLLGLPPDGEITLDGGEMDRLLAFTAAIMKAIAVEGKNAAAAKVPPADEMIELVEPSNVNAGPLEMEPLSAIKLALENRIDLKVAEGKVYDAQRKITVFADALGAELTLFGSARLGEGRSLGTANSENAQLRTEKGFYSAWLTLDLPFERTAERNAYRNGFITLERAVRDVQKLEDEIKISIRARLRAMYEARESRLVQARSLLVAETRVKSTSLFFEAGRIPIRDLLEAQDALMTARNALTAAAVDYRVAELEFQRDAGVLQIEADGLLKEYSPKDVKND